MRTIPAEFVSPMVQSFILSQSDLTVAFFDDIEALWYLPRDQYLLPKLVLFAD